MPDRNARVVLVFSLLLGCTPKPQDPATPPPTKVCTAMGCISGLHVQVTKPTPWTPGPYEFLFDIDGTAVSCKGALPLPACEQGSAITCDVADKVQIMESGCALPPEQHGFGDVTFTGEPKAVKVTIKQGETVLKSAELTPEYKTLQPNGPDCEPTCNSANGSIALP